MVSTKRHPLTGYLVSLNPKSRECAG